MAYKFLNGGVRNAAFHTAGVESSAQIIKPVPGENGVEFVSYLLQPCEVKFSHAFKVRFQHRRNRYLLRLDLSVLSLAVVGYNKVALYARRLIFVRTKACIKSYGKHELVGSAGCLFKQQPFFILRQGLSVLALMLVVHDHVYRVVGDQSVFYGSLEYDI